VHFIIKISLAAVRSQPNHRSEMVGQMLFGELGEILKKQDNWLNIRQLWDDSMGWIDVRQTENITPSEVDFFEKNNAHSLSLTEPVLADDHFVPILIGSSLPAFDGIRFKIGERAFTFSGQTIFNHSIEPTGEFLARIAKKYLFAPHLSGGRSPFGMDVAFFAQLIYKMVGIKIAATTDEQVKQGRVVHFMEETQAGDLAFFDDARGRIDHVGLIISDTHLLHVDGFVRADRVDHFGIFNENLGKYTHQMRVVKRFLPDFVREKSVLQTKIGQEIDLQQVALF
jgi:gamma-D-glutamyl-L-lysine dipeptidyl-peptidase